MSNETNPIRIAVNPLRTDAVELARQYALEQVEKIEAALAAVDFDLNKAAPDPNTNVNRARYIEQNARRSMFKSVTVRATAWDWRTPEAPHTVYMDQKMIDRFIETAKRDAAAQYDAFVAKLVTKIGECESAALEGNHVWGHSILTVTKADGSVEHWKTQCIMNVSKLGKPFHQWPTRKVKR